MPNGPGEKTGRGRAGPKEEDDDGSIQAMKAKCVCGLRKGDQYLLFTLCFTFN